MRRLLLALLVPWAAFAAPSTSDVHPGPADVRVATANLLMVHPEPGPLADELERLDADVLLLQEYSSRWERALTDAGFFEAYPHHVEIVRDDSFGIALLSRLPLDEAEIVELQGLPMARAVVQVDGQDLEIWSVHTLPPRTLDYLPVWKAQMDELAELTATRTRPMLMMGDFNASPRFPRLRAIELDQAHVLCGEEDATTWPNGLFPVPEVRLDHALISDELGCVAIEHGDAQGSDHRPFAVDLAWRGD